MAIRRRCRGPCRNGRRCLEHLWLDVKYRGERYRMPVNDFAVPRMESGKQRPIQSMEEARDWERLFIGEIKSGRDPRIRPAPKQPAGDPARRGGPRRLLRATPETLELCCRQGEMLLIQNKRVDWDTHTIGIPGQTTKDKENRRIPFDPEGRLAAILRRRGKLGPNAFVFGTENGEYVGSFKTAWEPCC